MKLRGSNCRDKTIRIHEQNGKQAKKKKFIMTVEETYRNFIFLMLKRVEVNVNWFPFVGQCDVAQGHFEEFFELEREFLELDIIVNF